MDIGVALPQFDYAGPTDDAPPFGVTLDWAVRAEQLGFRSVWLADHLFLSTEKYGGTSDRHRAVDPIVALAAVARATERVHLGTLVLCAQLRPPSILAKALATLDRLSAGRLIAGIGAGWYEPEYVEAGISFERPGVRLRQLAETIERLKAMWASGLTRPGPLQPVPIWVGGKGDRLLEVAATHADGWNTVWAWTPDAYKERVAVLHAACERSGRDPATIALSLGLATLIGDDDADLQRRFEAMRATAPPGVVPDSLAAWRQGRLVGTPDQVREQLAEWADVGVTTFIVGLGALPFAVPDRDDLERVASVLPA
jgi:alkanesulfonate monooxygenase SsuD/methylene tetrahydromethanopterin reductase-like flavin-dependent oxidoreductase (luciferase family)